MPSTHSWNPHPIWPVAMAKASLPLPGHFRYPEHCYSWLLFRIRASWTRALRSAPIFVLKREKFTIFCCRRRKKRRAYHFYVWQHNNNRAARDACLQLFISWANREKILLGDPVLNASQQVSSKMCQIFSPEKDSWIFRIKFNMAAPSGSSRSRLYEVYITSSDRYSKIFLGKHG